MAAEEQTMQDVSAIEIPQSPAELAEVAAAAAPRTEGMPIIHVEGLKRNYGKVEAVKGISFDVYPGEIFRLSWSKWSRQNHHDQYAQYFIEADSGQSDRCRV